jgi:hypothetical protein
MLEINQLVYANKILGQALLDSPNLPKKLITTLGTLVKLGRNPARIVSIIESPDEFAVTMKIEECYSSLPAVMCEGYNGGQNSTCHFESREQAEIILSQDDHIALVNLSTTKIQVMQLVRLVYNNKNLLVTPVDIKSVGDYHGVVGKSAGVINPYEKGLIKLLTVSQLLDNDSFLKLNIRGLR